MVDVARPPAPPAMDSHLHSALNGHSGTHTPAPDAGPKYATGMIYPPPDIRTIIDRTALHVARSQNPQQFEDRVRESQRTDPKFAFLNPADPYHAYYRHRIDRIDAGDDTAAPTKAAETPEPTGSVAVVTGRMGPRQPPEMEFVVPVPKVPALDLDTIRLTALFFAIRGPAFLAALSTREGRNAQFEFLRPTHPLFGYFSRLVAQYKTVLLPTMEARDELRAEAAAGGREKLLAKARERAEWERWRKERERKKKEDLEAERVAFAEIDWHDYAIVQTIEFTIADAQSELPPPMSVQEIESMTLAQKRMAQMINESTTEDIRAANAAAEARERAAEAEAKARGEAARAEAGAAVAGVKRKAAEAEEASAAELARALAHDLQARDADGDTAMASPPPAEDAQRRREEDDERRRELERARELQARAVETGAMKIRENYVPRARAGKAAQQTTKCSICGQMIAVDELEEHMRIELLDPRWKSQRDNLEARRAQANELQQGANVAASLRSLARTRVDIFGAEQDELARKAEEEAEKARAREREKVVWDGHTASKVATMDKFQTNHNIEEQIAAIHRAKGFGAMDTSTIGPGIGPSLNLNPTPLPPTPTEPAYAGAVISAGPQPASAPLYGGVAAPATFTPAPAATAGFVPPGMHPSRLAALSGSEGPAADSGDAQPPPAKRQRIERYDGHVYPEADWIALHPEPVDLSIQLPNMPDRPEWHLDGSVATVPDLPLTLLVSTLRDRIIQQIGSAVPVGRIRLSYQGKTLTNANTIASYNLEDGDVVLLGVRETKKK